MNEEKRRAYWNSLNPLEKAQFATAIGAKSVNSISQSIQAGQTWGEHRCLLVERYTSGALTRVDLLGDYAYDHWDDIPKPCAKFPPPKDGTRIDLFFHDVGRVTDCYWFEDLWEEGEWREDIKCWNSDSNNSWQSEEEPTHWLPLPTPPKDAP